MPAATICDRIGAEASRTGSVAFAAESTAVRSDGVDVIGAAASEAEGSTTGSVPGAGEAVTGGSRRHMRHVHDCCEIEGLSVTVVQEMCHHKSQTSH